MPRDQQLTRVNGGILSSRIITAMMKMRYFINLNYLYFGMLAARFISQMKIILQKFMKITRCNNSFI